MDRESKYFTLKLESLRPIGSWAADCAERALSVYEKHALSEVREVLVQMPAHQPGRSRLETILYELAAGIRARTLPQEGQQADRAGDCKRYTKKRWMRRGLSATRESGMRCV